MEYVKLNNNLKCPVVGLGTYAISPKDAHGSVATALSLGLEDTLIDTANAYVNERAVGRAIRESGVPRSKVFLSTKLWPSEFENPDAVEPDTREARHLLCRPSFHPSARRKLPCRIPPPGEGLQGRKGEVDRNINFEGKYIEDLSKKWEIVPQFIQVEAHPYFTQGELRKTLDRYGIVLMSWYPLGHGDKTLLEEEIFSELARKYSKTPAQVILRWHTQMGFVVIPGSRNPLHVKENFDILDFTLTEEEMGRIASLDKGVRYYNRTDAQLGMFASWQPEYEKE